MTSDVAVQYEQLMLEKTDLFKRAFEVCIFSMFKEYFT